MILIESEIFKLGLIKFLLDFLTALIISQIGINYINLIINPV